jgi:CheY-like chemotaxis protein
MEASLPHPHDRAEAHPLVLIVDDDSGVRDSLAAVVEAFGFRTATAGNGFEGLEAVGREAPSAVVTDLHMPEMDGFALLTSLHRTAPRIPVIAVSGGASDDHDVLEAAKRMGAVAAFHKPLPVLEMIDLLNTLTVRAAG